MTKYSIPKICQTNNFWYVYFLYEGKEFRFDFNYNKFENLKERQIYFEELAKSILKELKKGFNPNEFKITENLFLGKFTEKEIGILLYDLSEENKKLKTTPKHEKIFCNNGFVLFNHILNEFVKTNRGRLSDIHFYYWSLYDNKPQFIHQRPERFKEWFFENYNEDLGKIKTFKEVNLGDRPIHYSNALNWFKLQNQ